MIQEHKELLLRDLCARLPYKVIVDYDYNAHDLRKGNYVKCVKHESKCILTCDLLNVFMSPRQNEKGEYIKPYLRTMSIMTEEELTKLKEYSGLNYDQLDLTSFQNGTYKMLDFYLSGVPSGAVIRVFDWLNKYHFDYRDLIQMGLVIAVTKENNPYYKRII